MATTPKTHLEVHMSADTSDFTNALTAHVAEVKAADENRSEADAAWALADEYLSAASDPEASTAEREYARDRYADAVQAAKAAEATEQG